MMKDCDIFFCLMSLPRELMSWRKKKSISWIRRNDLERQKRHRSILRTGRIWRVCDRIHALYDGRQVIEVDKAEFNPDNILHASVVGRERDE